MADGTLTTTIANTSGLSVRAKSTEALTQAIHLAGDEAYVLHRTRICLKLYYDPQMNDADRAEMIDSYGKALKSYPKWAVAQAFDEWERTGTRRPSPADLRILAGRSVSALSDEVKRREREAAQAAEVEHVRTDDERAAAMRDLNRAGFTPKRMDAVRRKRMASSVAELYAADNTAQPPHWTETVAPDSAEMAALRKARAANQLVQQALKAAKHIGGAS